MIVNWIRKLSNLLKIRIQLLLHLLDYGINQSSLISININQFSILHVEGIIHSITISLSLKYSKGHSQLKEDSRTSWNNSNPMKKIFCSSQTTSHVWHSLQTNMLIHTTRWLISIEQPHIILLEKTAGWSTNEKQVKG